MQAAPLTVAALRTLLAEAANVPDGPGFDPGAAISTVSATNVYYPSSGAFGNKHFELWAINRGSIVGNVDTGNLPASSKDYVRSSRLALPD